MAGFPFASPNAAFPLGEEDQRMALIQGLLAGGGALMQAGGPSTNPTSTGQAFGSGIGQAMAGFQGAQRSAQAQKQAQLQQQYLQAQTGALTAAANDRLEKQKAMDALYGPTEAPQGGVPYPHAAGGQQPPVAGSGPMPPMSPNNGFPLDPRKLRALATVNPDAAAKLLFPGGRTSQLTPQEVAAAGLPVGTVAQRKPDGGIEVVSAADKPEGNTPMQRQYAQAVEQGYRGTIVDYQTMLARAGASSNNITVGGGKYGAIPAGQMLVEGPDGARLVDIPGSAAARDTQKANDSAAALAGGKRLTADVVTSDIDRIFEITKKSPIPVTGWGSYLKQFPGAANDVSKLLDTVKANTGFEALNQMRAASPTGGALGNVTEQELAMLQATRGSLEQSQSQEQFDRNLLRMKEQYLDVIHGPGKRPDVPGGSAPPALNTPAKRLRYNPATGGLE